MRGALRARQWLIRKGSVILLIELLLSPYNALAANLPTNGQYVGGSGTIGTSGHTLTVNQSTGRGVINWQSFSIGSGYTVQINNGAGATLNRVTGGDPSSIGGLLSATGSAYLINPAGVTVLPGGQVTTGGSFVASTRDLSNDAFMGGQSFSLSGTGAGDIINQGTIQSANGDVILVGRSVSNSGAITAPNGKAALVAGDDVLLQPQNGDNRILIKSTAGSGDVTNTGTIEAAQAALNAVGGNVYALAGNSGGLIDATGTATRGGHVWLTGGDTVEVGGTVSAQNADGSGGTVVATAPNVAIDSTAMIAANGTGSVNGGTILLGGDRSGGSNPATKLVKATVANADTTTIAAGAKIDANGGASGNGGSVVVWSQDQTNFAGQISATGGAQGGNGGFAEVSSHGLLGYHGTVDLTAPQGLTGNLLLDPYNVTISAGTTTGISDVSGTYTPTATSTLNTTDLQIALGSANITVATGGAGSAGSDAGNIEVQNSISWTGNNSLTLQARNNITVDNGVTITHSSGSGNLSLSSGYIGSGGSGAGTDSGTVIFDGSGAQVLFGGSTGNVSIYYNQNSGGTPNYASPASYSSNVTMGTGKLTAYMLVNTPGELTTILDTSSVWNNNFALSNNISMTGQSPTSILGTGTSYPTDCSTCFNGAFDGQNFTLSNVSVDSGSFAFLGLFGFIGPTGSVANLVLDNIQMTGESPTGSANAIGLLAGANAGTISNVSVESSAITDHYGYASIGGLVGSNAGTITNSTVGANNTMVTITGATSSTAGMAIGGLAGTNGTLSFGVNNYIGSITNSSAYLSQITASYSNTQSEIGGFVGFNGSSIQSSTSKATINAGAQAIGGFAGVNSTVTGPAATGSLLNVADLGTITDNAHGTGTDWIGGLVGLNDTGGPTITSAYSGISTISAPSGGYIVGGFVGVNNSSITKAFSTTGVSSSGPSTGVSKLGGFVGEQASGSIDHAFSAGSVISTAGTSASVDLGGFAGLIGGGTIDQTFSTGYVLVNGTAGKGYAGAETSGTVTNSHYDQSTSGATTDGSISGVTGLSTSAFQSATLASLGFDSAWSTLSNGYPYVTVLYSGTPQVISGTTYVSYLVPSTGTPSTVTNFELLGDVNGTQFANTQDATTHVPGFATAFSGANGYYYFLLPPNAIPASNGDVIVYNQGSNGSLGAVMQDGATGSIVGLNFYGSNMLRLIDTTGVTSYTSLVGDLGTAFGTNSYPALFSVSGGVLTLGGGSVTGANLDVEFSTGNSNSTATFTIDQTINDGLNGSGVVVLDSTYSSGTSHANIAETAPITGSGTLVVLGHGASYSLNNASNAVGTLIVSNGTTANGVGFTDSVNMAVGSNSAVFGVNGIGALNFILDESASLASEGSGGHIDVSNLKLIGTSTTDFELANKNNIIANVAAAVSGGSILLKDSTNLNIASITTGGGTINGVTAGTMQIGLSSGSASSQTLTQSASAPITANNFVVAEDQNTSSVNTTGATVTLTNTSNAITKFAAGQTAVDSTYTVTLVNGASNWSIGKVQAAGASNATAGLPEGTIALSTAGSVTQDLVSADNAVIQANKLLLEGGGSYNLNDSSNNIGTLAANTGALTVWSSAITLGTITDPLTSNPVAGITATGSVTLAGGTISLSPGISAANQLVNLLPSSSAPVTIGSGSGFVLTTSDLNSITANSVILGTDNNVVNASSITIDQAIDPTHASGLGLVSTGEVSQTAGSTITVGTLGVQGSASSGSAISLTENNQVSGVALSASQGNISFTNGTNLSIAVAGSLSGISDSSTSSTVTLNVTGAISDTQTVNVGIFNLQSGNWAQNAATLPTFSAYDFRVGSSASFLRVTGGNGTSATPYQIADKYGLQGIGTSATLLSADYQLAGNIDASGTSLWNAGTGFVPIGTFNWTTRDPSTGFAGTFDGNSKNITSLYIDSPNSNFAGLFGYVGNGATVENLTLGNTTVTGQDYVGGIAGGNAGTMTNDHLTSSNSISGVAIVGGLVGWNLKRTSAPLMNGSIVEGSSTGTVSGSGDSVGGLVGDNNGSIDQSYSIATVTETSTGPWTGGLVGLNTGVITNSYATGGVTGASSGAAAGGFAGGNLSFVAGGGSITNSYSTGTVAGIGNIGGFIGDNQYTLNSVIYNGSISGGTWDTQASLQPSGVGAGSSSGLTGDTTAQLQAGVPSGWDTSLWSSTGSAYPTLKNNP